MPRKNRVTPLGELIADRGRGLVYGNRGCLHDTRGEIRRSANGKRWIACRLEFRGWRRGPLMQPGKFTELFFLDEATAFAAGHRPCALCRHEDYSRFLAHWQDRHPAQTGADAVDAQLHAERVSGPRARRLHELPFDGLPDGAFVLREGQPFVVRGERLLLWAPGGYHSAVPRPARETAVVITPPSLVAVLEAGWDSVLPLFHPSAEIAASG